MTCHNLIVMSGDKFQADKVDEQEIREIFVSKFPDDFYSKDTEYEIFNKFDLDSDGSISIDFDTEEMPNRDLFDMLADKFKCNVYASFLSLKDDVVGCYSDGNLDLYNIDPSDSFEGIPEHLVEEQSLHHFYDVYEDDDDGDDDDDDDDDDD